MSLEFIRRYIYSCSLRLFLPPPSSKLQVIFRGRMRAIRLGEKSVDVSPLPLHCFFAPFPRAGIGKTATETILLIGVFAARILWTGVVISEKEREGGEAERRMEERGGKKQSGSRGVSCTKENPCLEHGNRASTWPATIDFRGQVFTAIKGCKCDKRGEHNLL